ncbi:NAD(P)-binding protein [Athelia psychrophila]|uniref:NAD(P)-binding protein n=1 Tax=Athelia psychrophila TaxID=1759441 RepID=A0A166I411_9AGAM|nr:NAD(P)-binding protein [Fibularhizoctonia sp. CBS 109695]
MSIPTVQKAWKVVTQGAPSKALVFDEHTAVAAESELQPGEVLVQVKAAALNPYGYKLMKMIPNLFAGRPFVSEHDLSGVVVAVHAGSKNDFAIGDSVFGWIDHEYQLSARQGALMQYIRMPASCLAPLPSNVSFVDAAGFPLAAATAWQGLFQYGKLEPGQTVFVNGGSSSVGGFAIQIAKARGCRVVASASAGNADYVRSLGADEFVDYTARPLHETLTAHPPSPKFHLILDAVGLGDPALYAHSRAYLAPNGIYAHTGPEPSLKIFSMIFHAFLRPAWLGGVRAKFKIFVLKGNKDDLYALKDLIQEGKLKPTTDSVFAFEDTLKAYDRLLTKRARGKVIVRVDPDAE